MSRETLAPIFDDPDRGLSNKGFAAEIGVHPATVSRYRSGKIAIPDRIAGEWEIRGDKWYRKG
ncbi:MAG: XRE family transcriptional regulator [Microcystis novacekii Mn_MB_F_20050700_S1]|uniref:XRE family transcriptional regulator n=1 Tax=Microcystis novacekii Mn_MB_F_20050700_S1D TaxID=2486266 RepID=A0A552IMV1_9CHRO|nr:MAG: XRE family transcriptional regulator [Microcystis novacekii Mn_MB_F_20050700_S1D]TRU91465.1 MAG: XRE family transcriptional regulator [Microcystis novacekii Mn_MB_F_20050700_S1]